MSHHARTTCLGCEGGELKRFLELGPQPLANAFLDPHASTDEARYPLDVHYCPQCHLVQLVDVIDPEVLFSDYIYVTGTSETIAAHNVAHAAAVVETLGLGPDDLVLEAASNDGSLLRCYREHGVRTLGVEPASNIARIARESGIETENVFFSAETGRRLRRERGPARVVIGNNVLAHVDDTVGFLTGAHDVLATDGRVVVEVPYLGELLARLEYDTVYHEHLCYFSVTALETVFGRAGLDIVRVDRVPVHGGSIRVWGARKDAGIAPDESVARMGAFEAEAGMLSWDRYARFGAEVKKQREQLLALLDGLRAEGKTVAAYGAPAKGNTLLNYCGIGVESLPYTVDRSPLKVGKLTPGMRIPVLDASELLRRQPDYCLILAWNFSDEIMRQQAAFRERGGRFILPLPEPKVVS